jgi:hypothetical protein
MSSGLLSVSVFFRKPTDALDHLTSTFACQLPAIQRKPRPSSRTKPPKAHPPASARIPSAIVDIVIVAVAGLSTWYLVRPQPLLFQNEVDATPLHNLSFCERQL